MTRCRGHLRAAPRRGTRMVAITATIEMNRINMSTAEAVRVATPDAAAERAVKRAPRRLGDVRETELVEKEGPVVGRHRKIQIVAARRAVQGRYVAALRDRAQQLRFGGMIRCEQYIKAEVGRAILEHAQLFRREGRFGEYQRGDNLCPRHEQMLARILDAGVEQRGCCQADHASGLVHVARAVPAADREHAIIVDGPEKGAPAFQRIEAVFAQAEGTGAGRCPGVDHAHLHQVELSPLCWQTSCAHRRHAA